MQKFGRAVLTISIILLLSRSGRSQIRIDTGQPGRLTHAQFKELAKSTSKLDISLQLDRSIYFPGEDMSVSLAISNQTGQALEVFEPLNRRTGRIELYKKAISPIKEEGLIWMPMAPQHHINTNGIDSNAPTRWITPGEKIELKFLTSDSDAAKRNILSNYAAPEREDEYQIRYGYGRVASATFRVVYPKLEAWTETVLPAPFEYHEVDIHRKLTGKISLMQRIVRVVALEYQGKHYVAASLKPITNRTHPQFVVGGPFMPDMNGYVGLYNRVATSMRPITSLKASSDASEHITITYTDDSGLSATIRLK